MERRTALILTLATLGACSVLGALFWPQSEEEQVKAQLARFTQAVGFSDPISNVAVFGSTLANRLKDILTEPVQLELPELQLNGSHSRHELAFAATLIMSRFGSLELTLDELTVTFSPKGAQVQCEATLIATSGGALRSQSRQVQFMLVQSSNRYLINAISVAPSN